MAENKVTTKTDETKETDAFNGIRPIVLSKEYDFEGEKIKEIDFSGANDINANNMVKIDRILAQSGNNVAVSTESTMAYALCFAAECTIYPIEFYQRLSPPDAIRVKVRVQNFLNGQG